MFYCIQTHFLLQETTADWMAVLRPLCVPQTVSFPKLQNLKFMKNLQLTVLQASRLNAKIVPMPYCLVSLNQVRLHSQLSPYWAIRPTVLLTTSLQAQFRTCRSSITAIKFFCQAHRTDQTQVCGLHFCSWDGSHPGVCEYQCVIRLGDCIDYWKKLIIETVGHCY